MTDARDDKPASPSRRDFLRGGLLRGLRRRTRGGGEERAGRATAGSARGGATAECSISAAEIPTIPRGAPPQARTRGIADLLPAPPPIRPVTTGARRLAVTPLRPPGALSEADFVRRCNPGCRACTQACPVGAIAPAPARHPTPGTPLVAPAERPCHGCPDRRVPACIDACPTGALHSRGDRRLGTARVLAPLCLAFQGRGCTACADICPVAGALGMVGAEPLVVARRCTGCGYCAAACPSLDKAMVIVPNFERSSPA